MKHYILQKLFQRKSCPIWMTLSVIVLTMLFSTNLSAQITQRGTATTGTSTSATVTVNKPTGVVTGDIMIANIGNYCSGCTQTSASLSGWSLIAGTDIERGRGTLLYKIAGASEPASYTFAVTASSTFSVGGIVAFSGVNNTTPFDVTPSTSWTTATNASVANIPSVTTLSTNTAVLLFGAAARLTSTTNANFSNTNWTMTSPATLTELFDVGNNSNNSACVGAAWATKTATGATGAGNVNCTVNTTPRLMAGIALVLEPACETVTSASSSPTLCANSALTNITHTTTRATGIGTATGLPTGVTPAWASNTITISGTPTVAGTYDYSIPLTGGVCGGITATGRIVVSASPVVTAAANTTTFCGSGTVNFTGTSDISGTNVIATVGFETTSNYTVSGGSTITGSSGTGDRPASTSFVNSGSTAYRINNGTATITTQNFTGLTAGVTKTVSMELASFSVANSTNGADGTDNVRVEISLDGGTSYSREIEVNGGATGNSFWGFSSGTGVASVTYDGNNSATVFAPTGGGARTTDGYSMLQITLPTTATQVRIRVTMLNNSANEAWVIDDIIVSQPIVPTYSWTSNPAGFTSALQNPTGVTVSASTTYTLTATNPATGCSGSGSVAITVTPNNTATAGSSTPTLCVNTALTNITHTTTGATGIGTATGLPTGVNPTWASNTITISGTPTATGTFNYTIPLTGGCGTVNATGTITVIEGAMTAGVPSSTPTLCQNTALTNITHTTTGATGIGTATGLPTGVNPTWASNTITISGTPTASGTFNYTIPLTGGCSSVNATGTITVTAPTSAGTLSGTQELCPNGTTTLSSSVSGGTWSSGATAVATIDSTTGVVTGVAAGNATMTYTVTGTGGCGNAAATRVVTVNSVLETTNATICAGGSGSLTVTSSCADTPGQTSGPNNAGTGANLTGVGTTAWSNPGNITAVGTPYATVAPAQQGTSNYLLATNYGFSIPANAIINGIQLTIARSSTQSLGTGNRDNQVRLVKNNVLEATNKSVGGVYPTGLTNQSYGNATDLWGSTWTAADINNAGFGAVLSVFNTRSLGPATATVDFMQITVTYTIPGSLQWYTVSSGGTAIGSGSTFNPVGVANSGLANTNTAGTTSYYVACSTAVGSCRAQADFVINALPTVNAGTAFTKTCVANTSGAAIGETAEAGHTYSWSPSTGLSSATASNPTANPTTTTTYTVTKTNTASGCTATGTVTVTVNNSAISVNAGTAFTKTCVANTSGAAVGETAVAGHTYSWSPSTGLSSATASNPTANPSTTTTYTVTKTNTASGCTATGTVTVTVNNSAISVNAGTAFTKTCVANTSGAAIGETAEAGHTYSWSPSTGLSSATASNPTANPTTTTTYTVTKTNTASGCTATGTVIVTVDNQAPTVTTSGNLSICVGSSATITASGATSYVWNNSLGTAASVTVSPSTTTTYNVTGTDANGCTNTAEATITVFPIQTVSVSIAASQTTICSGTSVTFTATPTNGGTNPAYQWKVDGINVGTNSPTFTSSTLANGNVVSCVMTSNATVCITGSPATSNTVTMTVNPNLPASVSVGASATSICVGTSVTFTATPTNGGTTPSYQWKLNGSNVGTNSATYTSSALADGNTVSVVMTSNASPCLTGSPATSNSISMIVAPTTVGGTISGGDVNVCHGSTPSDLTLTGHVGAVVRWEKATTNAFADAITIASTSAVLSGSLIGSVTGPVFIRAVVQSGNCNSVFSSTTSLNVASTTWNGSAWTNGEPNSTTTAIITGNFTPTADLYACSLTVSNQAVVLIPSAVDVILSGALTVEPLSSFTLEHDSNLTQTISASSAVNSGTIIVKEATQKLRRQDYVMFSSPVSGQKLQSFSPATLSSRFYTYNPASNLYTLVPSPSTTNFATGSGYLIRTPNNFPATPTVWTANYVGTPFNGTLTLPVTNGSYNAVGNPYPSTIDADMFFDANGITEALYFYRKTNGVNTSAYATYTKGGGVSSSGQSEGNGNSDDPNSLAPDGNIAVGQGFIVKATSNTVTFNNAMRLNSGAGVQLRASVERHRVWLNMTNPTGFFSQTLVAYMTGATNGVDAAIDGRYFNDNQTALTTIINGQEFAIQGRSLPFENLDVVSIGFKTEFATTYTISIEKVDGLFSAGQAVYLKDNLTNTYTNLRLGSYTFNSVAGVFNSRFELRFAALPTFYQDADGDSFGSAFNTIEAETAPQGYVSNGNDCNDNNALQNPNASEIAGNNIDDNCDGNVDEITSLSTLVATSCGVTLTNFANLLYAVRLTNVGPIQGYRYRVSNGSDVRIIESAVNNFSLVQLPGGATLGTTYAIEVSVKSNGFYRAYGPSCNVTTQATPTPTIISNPTCGATLANISASIYCNMVSNASGYRFRVRNGNTIIGVVDRTVNRFSLIDLGISNIAFGTTYTVDVLLAFWGELRPESEYGQACTFTTPATPGTSRVIQPSCGSVISNLWQLIYVQQVVGAQGYRFEISTGGQLYYHNSVRSSFSMRNVVGLPLNANTTYEIRVAILHNGVYQEFANACTFTTAPVVLRILSDEPLDGEAQIGDANLLETQSTSTPVFAPVAYPNPFGESFKVSIPDATMDIVNVLVYDFSGKLLDKKVIFASEINDYQFGNQLPSGDYLLVIGQGANVKSMHINKR